VLRVCPDLIPTLCPTSWERGINSGLGYSWPLKDLAEALGRLNETNVASTKFCFFIDGLDEYYGDHLELIKTIQHLACIPSVKICVSIRPWPCFEDAFGQDVQRKLYLQDLTKADMTKFARDKLAEHPRSSHLTEKKLEFQLMVSDIVHRAQGVFLWTRLVVRSLREGLTNGDTTSDLQQRLKELPSDLEDFFRRIIASVDKVYERRMAATFQVMLMANKPLPLMVCSFIGEESASLQGEEVSTNLELWFENLNDTLCRAELEAERQINGRFKGLLEAQWIGVAGHREVNFLHRTVWDFLMTHDIQALFTSHLDRSFNTSLCTCEAFLSLATKYPGSLLETDLTEFRDMAIAADIECWDIMDDVGRKDLFIYLIVAFNRTYHHLYRAAHVNRETVAGKALMDSIRSFVRNKARQDPLFLYKDQGAILSLIIDSSSNLLDDNVIIGNLKRMDDLIEIEELERKSLLRRPHRYFQRQQLDSGFQRTPIHKGRFASWRDNHENGNFRRKGRLYGTP
jgi:hypothetical protein